MLNPFPELLALSFFAPTLLRAALAIFFFALAYDRLFGSRNVYLAAFTTRWSGFGLVLFGGFVLVEIAAGTGLLLGFLTQFAALLALAHSLFLLLIPRARVLSAFTLPTHALVLIVSLSLLFTGAGAIAFDLPL